MSTNFFYKSFSAKNYRCLQNLQIEKLRRVNVIGGLNSVGKSTLLEALFAFLDVYNPLFLVRHAMLRGASLNAHEGAISLFSNGDNSKPITFTASTQLGMTEVKLMLSSANSSKTIDVSVPQNAENTASATTNNVTTYDLSLTLKSHLVEIFTHACTGEQVTVKTLHNKPQFLPHAVLYTKLTINNQQDIVTRFSAAVQKRLKPRLITLIQMIEPQVISLEILHVGGQPSLAASFTDGRYTPIQLLGGGALSLMAIALGIMNTSGGAVFLDEFDTAFHFSQLNKIWKVIAELAREFNSQIFAVTHSAECIKAAAVGLSDAALGDDLRYIRIDSVNENLVATNYSAQEVISSLEREWEVR